MDQNALVTKVFKARYFPTCSFLEAGVGSNPSFVWLSIRESQGILREGVRWRIGDGRLVKVCGDPRLPDCTNPYINTPELTYLNKPYVHNLFCPISHRWDYEVLTDIFCQRDIDLIMSIPSPIETGSDGMFWSGEEKGGYTVKSFYKLATGFVRGVSVLGWSGVWGLNIPPKVKCFF